jgi:hypothetical protein
MLLRQLITLLIDLHTSVFQMKLITKFPALVHDVKLPRFESEKTIFGLWDTSIDLEEINGNEIPVVLRVKEHGKDEAKDFRYRDGKFFASYDQRVDSSDFQYNHLEYWDVYKSFKMQAVRAEDPDNVHPPKILRSILDGQSISKHFDRLQRLARSSKITPENSIELADARDAFAKVMSSIIIVDGMLWRECGEPMISVDHLAAYGADVRTYHLNERDVVTKKIRSAPLGRFLYTIHELDEAFATKLYAKIFKDTTEIQVLDSTVFSQEVPIEYIIAFLDDLSTHTSVSQSAKGKIIGLLEQEDGFTWESAAEALEFILSDNSSYKPEFLTHILEIELNRINSRAINLNQPIQPSHGFK